MKKRLLVFLTSCLFIVSCGTNEAVKNDTSKKEDTVRSENDNYKDLQIEKEQVKTVVIKDFLELSDIITLITTDNLNTKSIGNYLKQINKNWTLKGSDEEEIYFVKDNNEATKELLTYHYKKYILEYLTFSKNHFFDLTKEIKNGNFEMTKETENEYGGKVTTYSTDKMIIMTEEIPLTEPGKSGFKILIAQKR